MSPPSTPTPRRFLLAKRSTQSSQTPTAPPQFHSTPRFGSSSVLKSTQARGGRGVEDVEEADDYVEGSSQGDENGAAAARKGIPINDSIEIESDAQTASQDGSDRDLEEGSGGEGRDSIEPDSLQHLASFHESSPLEEREPKRRKVSISPMPFSPVEEDGHLHQIPEDEGLNIGEWRQSDYSSSGESLENIGAVLGEGRALQQPAFLAPPRFKATEADMMADGLPAAFSPQRRGARYLPGGLAAGLQGWLSDIKGWEGVDQAADIVARVTVEEIRPGRKMYLVRARASESGAVKQFLLAGEGKLTGLGRRAIVGVGSVIDVGQPVWDVEMDGGVWTVSCDWSVS